MLYSEIRGRLADLRQRTGNSSIDVEEVFSVIDDLAAKTEVLDLVSGSVSIKKTYASIAEMLADVALIDSDGRSLRKGQLVSIINPNNSTDADNGKIYRFVAVGVFEYCGKLGDLTGYLRKLTNVEKTALFTYSDTISSDNIAKCDAISSAISSLYLTGINIAKDYTVAVVSNTATFRRVRIFELQADASTIEVCYFFTGQNSIKTSVDEILLSTLNNSGITGKCVIDWNKVSGQDYISLFFPVWKLNKNIITSQSHYDISQANALALSSHNASIQSINTAINATGRVRYYSTLLPYTNYTANIGKYVLISTGALTSSANYNSTGYISCKGAISISLTLPGSATAGVAFVDASFNYISGFANSNGLFQTVIVPPTTSYFIACYHVAQQVRDIFINYSEILNVDATYNERLTNELVSGIANLTVVNWTRGVNVLTSAATGWNNYAFLNVESCSDRFCLSALLKATNDGDFEIGIGKRSATAGTAVTLKKDNSGSSLCTYKLNNIYATESVADRKTLPFSLTKNTAYRVLITKNINELKIDIVSDAGDFYSYTQSNISAKGSEWGYPSIYCVTGVCECSDFRFSMNYNIKPKLAVFADSFGEGNSLADKSNRYVAKIAADLGTDNVAIFARGGESTTSVLTRIYDELEWFKKGKYVLLALGTNDLDFSTYQSHMLAFIARVKQYGMIPVLVTVTPRGDYDNTSFMALANPWVRSCGELFIDMNKAVTIDGLVWKEGARLADLVHPSELGHTLMYYRARLDAPYLFS